MLGHRQLYGFRPTKIFVFGDSYVDTGNIPKSVLGSWKEPYGLTFPGKPAGRFSDGRVLTDYLGKFININYFISISLVMICFIYLFIFSLMSLLYVIIIFFSFFPFRVLCYLSASGFLFSASLPLLILWWLLLSCSLLLAFSLLTRIIEAPLFLFWFLFLSIASDQQLSILSLSLSIFLFLF